MPRVAGAARQVQDGKTLSAMAHPLRRRLLEVLKLEGPATVTALTERTSSAPGSISHHLKVLAQVALVEEAPELARDRRERWWRATAGPLRWSSADFTDEAGEVVAAAAASLNLDHHVQLVRSWLARRADEPQWDAVAFSADTWLLLTPDELDRLAGEVVELFDRWQDRVLPDDGRARERVFLFAHGVPGRP